MQFSIFNVNAGYVLFIKAEAQTILEEPEPMALLLRRQYVFPFGINIEQFSIFKVNAGYVFFKTAEAPTILEEPERMKVVAEGTKVNVTCRVAGKPDPIITWYKNGEQITGGRYNILPTGDLQIEVGHTFII